MYETHYHLKTKPFTLLPDPEFLYLGAKHKMALSLLEYGLTNGSALIVIAGDPGTGKTTLLNRLLDETRHPWTVGVLSNTHVGIGGLLPWIAASFDLSIAGKSDVEAFHEFAKFLERERTAGRRVLLMVDEAQNIGTAMLEELRLLSNLNDGRRRSLQILLSGQLGLRDLLKGPGMVQFAQRIGVEYTLEALSEEETHGYMRHRLDVAGRRTPLFTTLASRSVFRLTGGTPRLINQLCDHALVYGFAAQVEVITSGIVLETAAARDRHGVFPFKVSPESVEWSQQAIGEEREEVKSFVTGNSPSNTPVPPSDQDGGQDLPVLYREAMALQEAGNFKQAIVLFNRVTGDELWGIKALMKKGLCLRAMGQFDEALSTFHAAIDRKAASSKDHLALQYLLGRTFEDAGKSAEAAEHYRRIYQEVGSYRDIEVRLDRISGSTLSSKLADTVPSSWWGGFFKASGRVPRDERNQKLPTLK
jgi:type II secretory pathway predicted ATPase ExeA/TolA-binding protein